MINDIFLPKFKDFDVDDLWFQPYAVSCHATNEVNQLIEGNFWVTH